MVLAHGAGIKIFATGGLGGVHRGAEKSMDISADLIELQRTPVTVVSSGCKSFLDIPKTLEFLETQGVCTAYNFPTILEPSLWAAQFSFHDRGNAESDNCLGYYCDLCGWAGGRR